jgi:purine-binding chemotaxis protein CheW
MSDEVKVSAEQRFRFVNFQLNNEWYGQDIRYIHEVNRVRAITEMPGSPPYILGVINLRNQVIPVMDLRRRLGLPPKEATKETRVIVVEFADSLLGLMVDSVHHVLEITKDKVSPPPSTYGANRFIGGIGQMNDKLIFFLDIEKIFSEEAAAVLEGAGRGGE